MMFAPLIPAAQAAYPILAPIVAPVLFKALFNYYTKPDKVFEEAVKGGGSCFGTLANMAVSAAIGPYVPVGIPGKILQGAVGKAADIAANQLFTKAAIPEVIPPA